MSTRKIITILLILIIIGLAIYFISSHISITKNTSDEYSDYTPQEEISEAQARETIITLYFVDKETNKIKSEKHIRILRFLMENDAITVGDLEIFTDTSRAIIKTLEKNGYIEIIEKQVERNPFLHKVIANNEKLTFTEEQKVAYEKIEEAIDDEMASKFLIFGVTGSRKNRNISANYWKSDK